VEFPFPAFNVRHKFPRHEQFFIILLGDGREMVRLHLYPGFGGCRPKSVGNTHARTHVRARALSKLDGIIRDLNARILNPAVPRGLSGKAKLG